MADLEKMLRQYAEGQTEVPRQRAPLEPRKRRYTLISVDDHVLEPPDTFTDRLPKRFGDRAPHIVRDDNGWDHWVIDNESFPLMGADAIITWEPKDKYLGPVNFDQVRRGTWDIHARVVDMDLAGIAASLNFPSAPFGFAGQRFLRIKDEELGLAAMRAYNDWVIESWAGAYPDRIIPCQVPWLSDPQIAAQEIERNAERGFKAVTFSENPEKLGLPSLYTGWWDPFFRA
ncbi:MAG TPA: amidohydrolase family protein, partial [Acidimicrobiales bacterium]